MSDKATDEKNTVAVGAKGVVLPPQRKGLLRRRPSRRLLIIVLGVVLVLAGIGTAAWLWSQRDRDASTDTQQQTPEGDSETHPQYGGQYDISAEAVKLINANDVPGGLALYDVAIEQAANDNEKRAGLMMEASEAVRVAIVEGIVTDRQYLQRSLDYALRAEEILKNLQSASQVWIVYRDMGNEAEAAKYEQLMMERDTSPGLENQ
jgi:flagellar basal body-associated protein FliL